MLRVRRLAKMDRFGKPYNTIRVTAARMQPEPRCRPSLRRRKRGVEQRFQLRDERFRLIDQMLDDRISASNHERRPLLMEDPITGKPA